MNLIKLKAETQSISRLVEFIQGQCERQGVGEEDVNAILLMVDELAANVCHYAYPGSEGDYEFGIAFEAGTCVFQFTDWGIPFDPTQLRDPDTTVSVEDRKIGGLGIFFIKKSSERFAYQRDGDRNVVTVVKRLGR